MIPKSVFEETLLQFFAPVRPYLDDASVSEIMINGPDLVYVERRGQHRVKLVGGVVRNNDDGNARHRSARSRIKNERHFWRSLFDDAASAR